MLILEGPDGGGKTTLAQELHEEFAIPIAPRVVKQDTTTDVDLVNWVDNNLEEGLQWKLFDRHRLISEPIYGTIVRSRPGDAEFLDIGWMTSRMQQFYDIMPIIVYCLPPLEVVMDNLVNDFDNTAIFDYAPAIYAAYVARASIDYALSPSNVFIWDYTTAGAVAQGILESTILELRENTHARV